MAVRPKVWVCIRWLAGIVSLNPARGMDVCVWLVLCIVRKRSVHLADHSSRGVLSSVVCLTECDHESLIMRRPWPTRAVVPW